MLSERAHRCCDRLGRTTHGWTLYGRDGCAPCPSGDLIDKHLGDIPEICTAPDQLAMRCSAAPFGVSCGSAWECWGSCMRSPDCARPRAWSVAVSMTLTSVDKQIGQSGSARLAWPSPAWLSWSLR